MTDTDPADGWIHTAVPVLGDGSSIEQARRPDLPDNAAEFQLLEDRGDTMLIAYRASD